MLLYTEAYFSSAKFFAAFWPLAAARSEKPEARSMTPKIN
jgi:hypothetical protein